MEMHDAPTLSIDQGAALLWLRKANGRAGCDRAGTISRGRDRCPLVFLAFEALERLGLVEFRLPADIADCRLEVLIAEAGARYPVDPAAERRLDALLRRFDD
jgi:hypothetical protein